MAKKTPTLTREGALAARPRPVRPVSATADEKGELRVTMEYARPRWQRVLGAEERCRRTFVLDRLGREVYEYCDGARTVRDLVAGFADRHKVSVAEAEYSVTHYLKTLAAKGLVVLEVERETA